MYIPAHFAEDNVEILHAFVRAHSLATLVTYGATGLQASPVPLLLADGCLRGHLAKANPHWKVLDGVEGLAIFTGDDYYVSPSLYPSKDEHGKVVPTWNYGAVHARGRITVVHDATWLRSFLDELTREHESRRTEPWQVSDAPDDYIAGLLGAIVGFEMRIEQLEGKFKYSQNRSAADREAVLRSVDANRP